MAVQFPSNDFTRMIEAVGRQNAAGGGVSGIASGEPQPAVRSRALGRVVEQTAPPEAPLSPQEVFELNQAAIAAGVHDDRLGNAGAAEGGGTAQDQYATLEEALAAGSSVRVPVVPPGSGTRHASDPRLTNPPAPSAPRLPNFKNVQGICLITGAVFVDDLEFQMDPVHLTELRKYAIETARDAIMLRLEEAVSLFTQTVEVPLADSEEMPPLSDGENGGGV